MGYSNDSLDITKNIKIIEMLKGQILSCIAELYNNMTDDESDSNDRSDILADLTILTYIFSNRVGISYDALELKIIKKLKLGVLEDNDSIHDDIVELLRHFKRK